MNDSQESGGLSNRTAKKTRHRGDIGQWVKQGEMVSVTPRLIDIAEASRYIGLQVDTIYRMVSQRRIPFVKVGRRTLFDVRLLNDWLDRHTVLPIPPNVA